MFLSIIKHCVINHCFFSKDPIQQLLLNIIRNQVWFIIEYFTSWYFRSLLVTVTLAVAGQGEVVANTIHLNPKEILTIQPSIACFFK